MLNVSRSTTAQVVVDQLGGSWVVISRLISPFIWVITIVTLSITPLITTHEPPRSLHPGIETITRHVTSVRKNSCFCEGWLSSALH